MMIYMCVWTRVRNHEKYRARFHDSCTIQKLGTKSCTIFLVKNEFWYTFLIKMTISVVESEEKRSKRRIVVKLVNKDQNYDPFSPIFQHLSSTIFIKPKNILVTHEIVHDRTIRYFSWFRTLDLTLISITYTPKTYSIVTHAVILSETSIEHR